MSYEQPSSLSGYETFFRQNSGAVRGVTEMRQPPSHEWIPSYVIFEDEILSFFELAHDGESPGNLIFCIPMQSVAIVKTDPRLGERSISITVTDPPSEIHLRAKTVEEMQQFLFAYQIAVALAISSMLNKLESASTTGDAGELARRPSVSYSLEEVPTPLRSLDDMVLHRKDSRDSFSSRSVKIRPVTQTHSVQDFSGYQLGDRSMYSGNAPSFRHMASMSEKVLLVRPSPLGQFYPTPNPSPDILPSYQASDPFDPYAGDSTHSTGSNEVFHGGLEGESSEEMFSMDDEAFMTNMSNMKLCTPHNTPRTVHVSTEELPPRVLTWESGSHSKKKELSKANQDRCIATKIPAPIAENQRRVIGYFGVYDGHGSGSEALAESLMLNLHHRIVGHPSFEHDMRKAIEQTCKKIDEEFQDSGVFHGSTAIGAFVDGYCGRLFVFNIGDCRAVLSRKKRPIELNTEHKPNRSDERERILSANGWLDKESVIPVNRLYNMHFSNEEMQELRDQMKHNTAMASTYRIVGDLSVSRTIGDAQYKRLKPDVEYCEGDWEFVLYPDGHNRHFSADLIIVDPEFVTVDLQEGDDFMVIASDGLWDVLSNELVLRRVQRELNEKHMSPQESAESLCDLARRLGSDDDTTVIIVQFAFLRK